MDITDMFKKFLHDREKNRKIVKTVPATPEWKAKHEEMAGLATKLSKDAGRLCALKKQFWAEVDLGMNDFSDKRYNAKNHEIEILDNDEDGEVMADGLVKSPFQIGIKE